MSVGFCLVFPDGSVNFTSLAVVQHPVWTSPEPGIHEDPDPTGSVRACTVRLGETCEHRYTLLADIREAPQVSESRRRVSRR